MEMRMQSNEKMTKTRERERERGREVVVSEKRRERIDTNETIKYWSSVINDGVVEHTCAIRPIRYCHLHQFYYDCMLMSCKMLRGAHTTDIYIYICLQCK